MRIGMIAPPWFPLPPQRYGGIEFVVSLLTEGLVARGHDVTLFASGDSETRARLSYIFARAPFEQMEDGHHLEVMHSLEAYSARASSTSSTITTAWPAEPWGRSSTGSPARPS